MRKGANIFPYTLQYEEAVSHIWLCNCSTLNFLIYEENSILIFSSVMSISYRVQFNEHSYHPPNPPPPPKKKCKPYFPNCETSDTVDNTFTVFFINWYSTRYVYCILYIFPTPALCHLLYSAVLYWYSQWTGKAPHTRKYRQMTCCLYYVNVHVNCSNVYLYMKRFYTIANPSLSDSMT